MLNIEKIIVKIFWDRVEEPRWRIPRRCRESLSGKSAIKKTEEKRKTAKDKASKCFFLKVNRIAKVLGMVNLAVPHNYYYSSVTNW